MYYTNEIKKDTCGYYIDDYYRIICSLGFSLYEMEHYSRDEDIVYICKLEKVINQKYHSDETEKFDICESNKRIKVGE